MPGPFLNSGIFQTRVTDTSTTAQEELGVWRFENGKIYRYNKAGALLLAYQALKLDTTTGGQLGAQVIQVTTDTDVFLGVAEVTIALNSFGWITTYGPATCRVAVAAVPGVALGPANATGALTIRQVSN